MWVHLQNCFVYTEGVPPIVRTVVRVFENLLFTALAQCNFNLCPMNTRSWNKYVCRVPGPPNRVLGPGSRVQAKVGPGTRDPGPD